MTVPPSSRPAPVLVVLHQETSSPGRLGQMLTRRGHTLDIRRPRFGDPLPTTLERHAGAIVFGGPMSANDDEDWIRREIDWVGVPLAEGKPFLGICLGAQMLARHLGATVKAHPRGEVEVGWYPLHAEPEARDMLPWPQFVYQWHTEGFDVPSGARLLAKGERFSNQAMVVGRNAFGIQFHPELTLAMMHRWTVRAAHRLEAPGAQARHHHFEGRGIWDHQTRLWTERLLDLWLAPAVGGGGDIAATCDPASGGR